MRLLTLIVESAPDRAVVAAAALLLVRIVDRGHEGGVPQQPPGVHDVDGSQGTSTSTATNT